MTKSKVNKGIELLIICKEALESCGDNEGSEEADDGNYEQHYDYKLVDKALKLINTVLCLNEKV